ncbi:MAG: cellulase family glycosylhydrolase [Anaerolineae bacterium]|nr:cellulase family glycosylhydrolase [Anaerolineae bacterium]
MDTTGPFLGRLEWLLEGKWGSRLLSFVLIPLLVIAALLLPPISGLERVLSVGHVPIGWEGGALVDPDGTQVTFPAEGLGEPIKAKLEAIPRVSFLEGSAGSEWVIAAENLPNWLIPKSPLYVLSVRGREPAAVIFTLPIPNDAEPHETLDLYTWNSESTAWEWLPSQIIPEDDLIEARLDDVPVSVMVMQTNPHPLRVAADLPPGADVPAAGREALTEVYAMGLNLGGDGSIEGDVHALPQAAADVSYAIVPMLRNWYEDGTVRTDLINNLLVSREQQEVHFAAIEALVVSGLYAGVDLDYRGVDPALRAEFTAFVSELAGRLHAQGKQLSLRVEAPFQIAADRWETGGYDWRALGRVADAVSIPAIVDPRSYAPGGQMEALLNWAVGEIERSKIQLVLPARSVEKAGQYLLLKGYDEALQPLLGQIQSAEPVVVPGQPVNLTLLAERQASGLIYDQVLGSYSYQYRDNAGDTRTVWLENAASLAQKMSLAERYHLRGLTLQHLLAPASDPEVWDLARRFQEGAASPGSSNYALAWKVTDADGRTVAVEQRPLGERTFSFSAPERVGGELRVEVGLADRGRPVASAEAIALSVATATPTVTPTPTPTPTPEFTPTPVPTPTPNRPQVVVNGTYNVRSGPGTNYPRAGQVQAGQTLEIVAKNPDGTWWQVCCVNGQQVWIKADLAPVQGPTSNVTVASNIPPTPTPAPQQSASPPPASGACAFGYGIQAEARYDPQRVADAIKDLGFNWFKQQVPWEDIEPSPGNYQWGWVDNIVNVMNANGIKVMLSVPKAPCWARDPAYGCRDEGPPKDPNTYGNFMGQMAARYKGKVQAYEIWNEQNMNYEWGYEPFDAGRYVRLLQAAYQAIKAQDPAAIVISGAPTPTGSGPPAAVDDFIYLEQMLQAGMARYCDAVGVHPSGYNVPPDLRHEQVNDPTAIFRGPSDNKHHSWSFRSTMEGYRNYLVTYGAGNKCLWPTEFGWASSPAPVQHYEYAADNTLQEQADFTVRAYQMMKNWGFVGTAFLWNLNYEVVAPGSEMGQWGIVDSGWGPRPVYNALKNMAK